MLLIIFDVAIDVTRALDENVVKEIYVIYDANVVEEFDIFHIMLGCSLDAISGNLRKDLFLKNNKLITSTHFLDQKLSWDRRRN